MATGTIQRKAEKYEIGDIYITTRSGNPATLLGYGTWAQIKDRFLLAAGDTYAAGATGGEASHQHLQSIGWDGNVLYFARNLWGDGDVVQVNRGAISNSGAGVGPTAVDHTDTRSNMPPYLAVYMWLRTA